RLCGGSVSEQAFPARQEVTEAGVLEDDGAPQREVSRAAVAKPPTPAGDVRVLGNAELGPGPAQIPLVGPRVPGHLPRVPESPPPFRQPPLDLHGTGDRNLHLLPGLPGEREERYELPILLAVDPPLELPLAKIRPVDDRGERGRRVPRGHRPKVQDHRLPGRQPPNPGRRHAATRPTHVLTVGKQDVVGRKGPTDPVAV